MYFVYILFSLKTGKKYVGFTGRSLRTRIREHNSGYNKWTRGHRPLRLVYFEKFSNKKIAIKRENFLKSGQGRKLVNDILKNRAPR